MSLEAFSASAPRLGLGADVARAGHAAYAVELVQKLCAPRQPEPAVYDWLDELLTRLEAVGASAARVRAFELGLLARLGIGPELSRCVSCGRSDFGDEDVRFLAHRGGLVCGACAAHGSVLTPVVRKTLVRLLHATLAGAESEALDRDVNAGCRGHLADFFRLHIPGPLKSVEFMSKMKGA